MKHLTLAALIFFVRFPAFAEQNGYCVPSDPSAQGQPICAIYMHGLFGTAQYPESAWERPFRQRFEAIAKKKNCRIAIPIGEGKPTNWNGFGTISSIKERALRACGGGKFSERPDIIGFSNGANRLRRASCDELKFFRSVTLIGANRGTHNDTRRTEAAKACGNVTVIADHSVPPASVLEKTVTYSEGRSPSPSSSRSSSGGSDPSFAIWGSGGSR